MIARGTSMSQQVHVKIVKPKTNDTKKPRLENGNGGGNGCIPVR